ncbi:UDP-N-acetylmuramoylalanyl-D-glutamyl-2,6-diaminopimelate--D-alanyl-D-alanine ligase [Bartonella krasnovii]|uniref:UDP-N-acetylmuramoyl-tripeptide--D-alanyl-D-alanine ligase n=1 Tax=Bartonella krasnovii TaxID=2267275 RepID=A0A5B9D2J4_9HYPH|nr:UDP-N-acetylmuramoylalanyl-D-glutamyl-2,6-diaminopimelate--D-alanyl-D-alanine ligase [Bartonella krasnovii]QEE12475.1 UDP-N-acetylmuramoylalanyl-D-glutamyl-2,6-diaminopimelate--D-alanyl-D-alanine ligase [Bartonella krasnovii]UNF48119.1 UDP-N-acetylmuramoylalanyl-D-glutamyl-2,6-diaminopimelate--D-alanyl-D-alanine ligase [Bartonella krasnovii]UNF53162.1 UDP-N-acetylmuramoylalanyl-D-glutamyl-2,6-diaminopimelate--D-alanyl-D-alanine ligase [Bartonella krasnovii]
MTTLWDKQALVAAIDGIGIGNVPETFTGVSIDSRTLVEGDIFFCIKGNYLDGHDFAAQAYARGAGVLIVAENRLKDMEKISAPLIVVPDVLQALEKLGKAARKRSRARIIAITGSVGKTTTKEALKQVLAMAGNVHANLASLNNCWGVPLTLARMPKESDYGIFEIGMNHKDEIRPLVKLVCPHVALITHICAGHMGFFKDLEEIAEAKAEIFEGLNEKGIAILNADSDFFSYLVQKAMQCGVKKILSFGETENADYQARDIRLLTDHSSMMVRIGGQDKEVQIGAPGRHIVQNSLAVLAVCDAIGVDLDPIALSLSHFSSQKGRGVRYRLSLSNGGEFYLIDESYNANPASMRAALELLATGPVGEGGRRIAVLGDMLELGKYSEKLHRDLIKPIRFSGANPVFLFGKAMKSLVSDLSADVEVHYDENIEKILPLLLAEISPGDLLMIKSSNSLCSSNIVTALLERYKAVFS